MVSNLIKGILIGLLFGIPVGAVGTMTVHRTLNYGFRAGLMTGLGSSIADCFYAFVGVFSLTLISDFLLKYQSIIHFIGGTFILIMGIKLILLKREKIVSQAQGQDSIKMFLSSFAIGITNPAAIVTFLFAFSYFEIAGQTDWIYGILLVVGVFIGTYIWWTLLSMTVSFIKKKTMIYNFQYMNKIFGGFLFLFGIIIFIKSFL